MTDYSEFELEEEEPKVSRENALKQIQVLLKKYRINFKQMTKKDKEQKGECVETIIDCIMRKIIDISLNEETGKLEVTQYIEHRSVDSTVEKIVYGQRGNKDHIAMAEGGENEYLRLKLLLKSMSMDVKSAEAVGQLSLSDDTNAKALALLFL